MKKHIVVALALALLMSAAQGVFAQTPVSHFDRVLAHSTDTYQHVFAGGRLASVAVSGDGDTDLDLYVYDENGHLVASDTDLTDQCYVSWVPRWTGTFTIKIVNRGNVFNRYHVVAS
jgi:hypothetical protein